MEEQPLIDSRATPQIAVIAEALKATRINKMVMHGFKSFAKHTEILFGGNFNCVLGLMALAKAMFLTLSVLFSVNHLQET